LRRAFHYVPFARSARCGALGGRHANSAPLDFAATGSSKRNKPGDGHGHERHGRRWRRGPAAQQSRIQTHAPRRECERSRCLAGESRGLGRAQAHHGGGRPRSRSGDHHVPGRQRTQPSAPVREHQGAPRPPRALQHGRLQPDALLPDDRRTAGGSPAQGGANPAAQARPQAAAQGSLPRTSDLQSERRRRRRHRHPHLSRAAHVAARRRQVSRHR